MTKVLPFPAKKRVDQQVQKLKSISDAIDAIIIDAITNKNVDHHELAGLMAHRLGALLRHFEDKDKTWGVCEKVLKKQAVIE